MRYHYDFDGVGQYTWVYPGESWFLHPAYIELNFSMHDKVHCGRMEGVQEITCIMYDRIECVPKYQLTPSLHWVQELEIAKLCS
jgi:hypothetical protein